MVANLITKTPQFAGEFMVIDVLGKFSGAQQFIILQCLPALLHWIKGRVEHDAMRVQMRVEGTRGVMGEQRRRKIAGGTVAMPATSPNAGCGKCFEFPQCRPDSMIVSRNDPFICTSQCHD